MSKTTQTLKIHTLKQALIGKLYCTVKKSQKKIMQFHAKSKISWLKFRFVQI